MKSTRSRFAGCLMVLLLAGCPPHGFAPADQLEASGLGPTECANSCQELGLQMAALVLVQHTYSGCVCEPVASSGGASLGGVVTGAAAAQIAIEVQRQAAARAAATQRARR